MLKDELGLDSELKVGSNGIFQVAVDGKVVAERGFMGFPSEEQIVSAVAQVTGR